MIFLIGTTETLNVRTVGAGTIHYTAYYADHTFNTFTANSSQGSVAAAQTTVIVTGAANLQRQIKTVIVVNRSVSAQTVIITKVVGGVENYLSANTILGPGQTLMYSDERGFQVRDTQDSIRRYGTILGPIGNVGYGKNWTTNILTRIMQTNAAYYVYLGKAPRNDITQISIRYRVTTAGAGATIAEIGIYTGPAIMMPTTATAPTVALQCVGFTSWLANYATIGNYTTTVPIGTSTPIKEGDGIWCSLFSTFATTGATLRVCAAEDVYYNMTAVQVVADRQPSLEVGYITQVPMTVQVTHINLGYSLG